MKFDLALLGVGHGHRIMVQFSVAPGCSSFAQFKAITNGERHPLDEDLLLALGSMPESAGVTLGLDCVIMLAAGALHIEQVQWRPVT